MRKNRDWKTPARWILAFLTLITGALLIDRCVGIFLEGTSAANLGADGIYLHPVFSREIVSAGFRQIALPVWIFLVVSALALLVSAWDTSPARVQTAAIDPMDTLAKMKKHLPSDADVSSLQREERLRKWVQIFQYLLSALCIAFSLYYLLDVRHFTSWDLESVMRDMLLHVLPYCAIGFLLAFIKAEIFRRSAIRELAQLKTLLSNCKTLPFPKQAASPSPARRIVQMLLFTGAGALILLGALNGGAYDVLVKAINICTECIGLG